MSRARNYRQQVYERRLALLKKDVNALKASGELDRCVLIGSYAKDQWTAASDIDLICIGNSAVEAADFKNLSEEGVSIDVFSITPDTLEKRSKDTLFFTAFKEGLSL